MKFLKKLLLDNIFLNWKKLFYNIKNKFDDIQFILKLKLSVTVLQWINNLFIYFLYLFLLIFYFIQIWNQAL